ncbi:MAG: hypothetical protein U1E29_18495 [Coriobacteriia bacterium]|nr:hypothetical protein [Coriobacteriia bacterium]
MAGAPKDRQQYALQTIFSFFLGLMVLAFIGIGVNTFYPEIGWDDSQELRDLYQEQDRIYQSDKDGKGLTAAQEKDLDRIQDRIEELNKETEAQRELWARNTSIVLIIFATLVMGVSLVRSEQLRVLSNGLLLGGLFTMIYGVGWIIFAGESLARFGVIVFALLITLGLGYMRFVRGKAAEMAPVAAVAGGGMVAGDVDAGALAALMARIDALEARTAAAARALRAAGDEHDEE